jgi:hypothetical protein
MARLFGVDRGPDFTYSPVLRVQRDEEGLLRVPVRQWAIRVLLPGMRPEGRSVMKSIVISAGRNIGPQPMDADRWNQLRAAVARVMESSNAQLWTRDAIGYGEWVGDDGTLIREESVTYAGAVSDGALEKIQRDLQLLAKQFEQDAIALIVGESLLVRG